MDYSSVWLEEPETKEETMHESQDTHWHKEDGPHWRLNLKN